MLLLDYATYVVTGLLEENAPFLYDIRSVHPLMTFRSIASTGAEVTKWRTGAEVTKCY